MSAKEKKVHHDKETDLRGTLASVSLVGLFIVITWVGAFTLFLSRGF